MSDAKNRTDPIDLNTATLEELVTGAGLTEEDAEALLRGRPYGSWSDVGRLTKLDADLVNGLKSRGVKLGVPTEGPIGEPGSGGSASSAAGNLGRA
jgi:DNA uptake protein ComE-like DNA-binding protein